MKKVIIILFILAIGVVLLWVGRGGKPKPAQTFQQKQSAQKQATLVTTAIKNTASYSDRLKAIHELATCAAKAAATWPHAGTNLNQDQIQELYGFLRDKELPEGFQRLHIHVLKNDLLNALHKQNPAGLTRLLIDIYQDREQDLVIRDYAIQHLSISYSNAQPEEKAQIQQVFWQALDEKEGSIPGTALISLQAVLQTETDFNKSKLLDSALRLAADQKSGELTRITALQICAKNGVKEVLSIALDLAKNSQSVPVKISAIAALGKVGGKKEMGFLENLSKDSNSRLQPAAKAALERLKRAQNAES